MIEDNGAASQGSVLEVEGSWIKTYCIIKPRVTFEWNHIDAIRQSNLAKTFKLSPVIG